MATNKTTVQVKQELIDSNPAHLSESWSSDSDSDSSSFDYETVKDLLPPGFLDPLPKTQTSISIESSRGVAVGTSRPGPVLDSSKGPDSDTHSSPFENETGNALLRPGFLDPLPKVQTLFPFQSSRGVVVESSNAGPVLDSSKGPDSLPLSKQSNGKGQAKLGDNGYIRLGDVNGKDDVRTLRKQPSKAGGFLVDEISNIDTQKVFATKRANDSSSASQEMPRRDNLFSKRIKGCYAENHSSGREVEDALAKLRRGDISRKSRMNYLMELLEKHNFIHDEIPMLGNQTLKSIVFAPPKTLNLIRLNPRVIVIDTTYKTISGELPLIEIFGIVSTGMNFHLAFAFISNAKRDFHASDKESYLWIMQWVKTLYASCDVNGPNIIVTNRELALTYAIGEVFPHAAHLLCRRHIKMDCQGWLASRTGTKKYEKKFGNRWDAVVFAPNETAYEVALESLRSSFHRHTDFLLYLDRTWLTPYRERFVSAWTREYMHFGAETTNREECAHFHYKNMLGSTNSNLIKCFQTIIHLVEFQHEKIRKAFEF